MLQTRVKIIIIYYSPAIFLEAVFFAVLITSPSDQHALEQPVNV